jgi:hypothetical protein
MSEDLEKIEVSIEDAKKAIARKDALNRLENNPDFKELITNGFLKDHAIRQVMMKAHPGYQSDEVQKNFDQQIIAVGQLKQYLVAVFAMGNSAAQALGADEATREELLAEDLING